MPAAAVARRTPAIAGISGTSFGASGEIAVDIRASLSRKRRSALYHLFTRGGRVSPRRPAHAGPITTVVVVKAPGDPSPAKPMHWRLWVPAFAGTTAWRGSTSPYAYR